MSKLRFNHVFAGLLVISFLCAFVISPRFTNPARALVQGVFVPVARPSRAVAAWTLGRYHRPPSDPRADRQIEEENRKLKATVAHLTAQVEQLQAIAADYERIGSLGQYCTRVTVSGTAAGARDGLLLQGSFAPDLVKAAVLYAAGSIAGRIERAGVGGAQVQLVTDRGFRVRGRFGRYTDDGRGGIGLEVIETREPLVEGAGGGQMVVKNLQMKDVKDVLRTGDWVILDDPEWHRALKFARLGQITDIRPRPDAPLFADVYVDPQWNLLTLSDVMVMNKTEPAGYATQGGSGNVDAELERGALVDP